MKFYERVFCTRATNSKEQFNSYDCEIMRDTVGCYERQDADDSGKLGSASACSLTIDLYHISSKLNYSFV